MRMSVRGLQALMCAAMDSQTSIYLWIFSWDWLLCWTQVTHAGERKLTTSRLANTIRVVAAAAAATASEELLSGIGEHQRTHAPIRGLQYRTVSREALKVTFAI